MLAADGYDSPFNRISEGAWSAYVARFIELLRVKPSMSVFEIGCGAGAFLAGFYERGCSVSGLDLSEGLIQVARSVMPTGRFEVAEATSFTGAEPFDVVLAQGVFSYFPSQSYAQDVLAAMARSARHAVAVLGLQDIHKAAAARARRISLVGEAEYISRYEGLEHQLYDRQELADFLAAQGCSPVLTDDVQIDGYANAPYRFDIFGFKTR
jgi:cyclopropane fatty-acyl-phospholipid synthase-like methyltransferase